MRSLSLPFILLCGWIFWGVSAHAGPPFIDVNVFYMSSAGKDTSTSSNTETFYDLTFGVDVDTKGRFQIGWDYVGQSTSSASGGTTQTYAGTQMGPRFIGYFDKNRSWRASVAYNLESSATANLGSGALTWKGSSIFADVSYIYRPQENLGIAGRLNYSASTYNEQSTGGSTYTGVSNSRTFIYPSLAVSYDFF